jgi:quinol-cytochrome oxidoreductase complex cytochrome b subunit
VSQSATESTSQPANQNATPAKLQAELQSDVRKNPRRIAFILRRTSPQVRAQEDPRVMTYPGALARFVIALEIAFLLLVWVSLIANAPLEGIADPTHTPNPAKAPWYFLGLQELLHYFPPVYAGVLIPGLVVAALVVIPYFNINIEGRSIWAEQRHRRWVMIAVPLFLLAIFLLFDLKKLIESNEAVSRLDRLLDLIVPLLPTVFVGGALLLSSRFSADSPRSLQRWLADRPISFWIMTWFLVELIVLTAVGTFFRGAGWTWVWPANS